jgi:predicted glycogen debranching enzyme
MIKIQEKIQNDFAAASSREWLDTNCIGGYASASVSGANTRRYHGLLVAATRPPLGRVVMLSKFEETLVLGGERFDLSCNQYPGTVHPKGYKYLTSFRSDPFPIWTFEVDGIEIEHSVFMIYGENSTVIRWKVNRAIPDSPAFLELKPLLAFRDHHHLRKEDSSFAGSYDEHEGLVSIRPYNEMPGLHLAHNADTVDRQALWYRDFEYAIEQERGFDYREDLFQPFSMTFDLSDDAVVIASTEIRHAADAAIFESDEIERRQTLISTAGAEDDVTKQLVLAADQFIVSRGTGKTIIAGYHWFSDWGRDTMISLNGLTLATNRTEVARSILLEFSKHISEGMIPNRFPDAGEFPEYNTVDATLWFFEAIRAFAAKTSDHDLIRQEFYEKLVEIIEWHVRGTRYGIHVDTDGLLYAGEAGVQLTWMDAKIGNWVVTPRIGKAVEIQALWYNALCIMADMAARYREEDHRRTYESMAAAARSSFNGQFWNQERQCLYDVVNGSEKDGSVRPNQIFAVSLPYTMLDTETGRKVVEKVEGELLTPVGLRSLSSDDPDYVKVYIGTPYDRDAGYHQGTVWGWLIGPFVDAYRRVHPSGAETEKRISEMISGFRTRIGEALVGQVSEIFDAEKPHKPRGCAAQAWSVAELLRIVKDREEIYRQIME